MSAGTCCIECGSEDVFVHLGFTGCWMCDTCLRDEVASTENDSYSDSYTRAEAAHAFGNPEVHDERA